MIKTHPLQTILNQLGTTTCNRSVGVILSLSQSEREREGGQKRECSVEIGVVVTNGKNSSEQIFVASDLCSRVKGRILSNQKISTKRVLDSQLHGFSPFFGHNLASPKPDSNYQLPPFE